MLYRAIWSLAETHLHVKICSHSMNRPQSKWFPQYDLSAQFWSSDAEKGYGKSANLCDSCACQTLNITIGKNFWNCWKTPPDNQLTNFHRRWCSCHLNAEHAVSLQDFRIAAGKLSRQQVGGRSRSQQGQWTWNLMVAVLCLPPRRVYFLFWHFSFQLCLNH